MNQQMILIGKLITLTVWGMFVLSLIGWVPPPMRQIILLFGTLVAIVHVFEVAYLMLCHRAKVRSPAWDAVNVMLFGVFTLQPLISTPAVSENH